MKNKNTDPERLPEQTGVHPLLSGLFTVVTILAIGRLIGLLWITAAGW